MRISTFVKSAISAVILVGATLSANAASHPLGTLAPSPFAYAGNIYVPNGLFTDILTFDLAPNGGSFYKVTNAPLDLGPAGNLNLAFTSFTLFSNLDGTLFNGDDTALVTSTSLGGASKSLSATGLASGHYYLMATGLANGSLGGQYTYAINVSPVTAPVPEPETYAMLLAGLGLMGAIARRRNKA